MKKKKTLIIIIASIIALLAIAIGFLIKGCREEPQMPPDIEISFENPDPIPEEQKTLDINTENRIYASKYSPIDYSILVPKWEALPDYYYEQLGNNQEFLIGKEWIVLDNSNNFNFYTRGFISEDKKAYLFITEYLGNVKFPCGGQGIGLNDHSQATDTIAHIEKKIYPQYQFENGRSNWTEEELIYKDENIQRWRFLNGFYVLDKSGNAKSTKFARGYCLMGLEIPIVVYAYDATEDQIHAESLKRLTESMIKSIIVDLK